MTSSDWQRRRPASPVVALRLSWGATAVIAGFLACSEQPRGTPGNIIFRMFLREIYHQSSLTARGAFDVSAVRGVWQTAPVLGYDESLISNQFLGELRNCGIESLVLQNTAVTATDFPLVQDSGFYRTQSSAFDPTERPHPDAQRLFDRFRTVGDTGMLVFLMPRFLHLNPNLTYEWVDYFGATAIGGPVASIAPSIWLNSRKIVASANFSTLAHEVGHLLLTRPNPEVWFDNSTPFIHILYTVGTSGWRRTTPGPGPVQFVTATDANRRNLIMHQINNACVESYGNTEFVRPALP